MSEIDGGELALRMADLARATARPNSIEAISTEVCASAMGLIPDVDTAAVVLRKKGKKGKKGKYETVGATCGLPQELNTLQIKLGEGPCIDACSCDELIVHTADFITEHRWPRYSTAVVELGVRSALSVKLYTDERTAGALSLFSFSAHSWPMEAQMTTLVLAAHAASAILASRESTELSAAVTSRDRIGQAKGVIMERFKVDDLTAFDMLRRLSQDANVRLAEIADQVINTVEPR